VARFLAKLALTACILLSSTTFAAVGRWTALGPEGGDIYDLAITPSATYALTPKSLYRSTDTGRTWSEVGDKFRQAERLIAHPTQPNRIFILADGDLLSSTNGGQTRVKVTPPSTPSGPIQLLEFSQDGTLLYGLQGRTLHRSADLGATWTTGGTMAGPADDFVRRVYIHPTNANRVIAQTRDGIYITNDAGDHWASFASPPNTVVDVLAFSASGPRIWATTPDGLWYTSNDGANWTVSAPFRVASALAVHPTDPSIVYAQVAGTIYRTTDGGVQWTPGNGTHGLWYVNRFSFDPQNPDRVLIATLNGVWESTDRGANWSPSNRGIHATTSSRFTSTTNRTYFAVRGEIYYLEPGANAAKLLDPTSMNAVLPFHTQPFLYALHADRVQSGDRLFVSAGEGLARSIDSGQTWVRLTDPLVESVSIRAVGVTPDNPDVVLAVGTDSMLRSIDGGDHWSAASGVPTEHVPFINDLTIAPAGLAFASGGQHVYKTTDGGLIWSRVDVPAAPTDFILNVLIQGNSVYLGTTSNGYRSTDSGSTWTTLQAQGGRFAADASGLYFAGKQFLRSLDGGNSWEGIGSFVFFEPADLHLDPNAPGHLLSATWGNGLQSLTLANDLSISGFGTPPGSPGPGVRVEINISVSNRFNTSLTTASGVKVNLSVADGRVFYPNADCIVNTATPSQATCTLPPLRLDQRQSFRIEASYETAGNLNFIATASANEMELVPLDNTMNVSWDFTRGPGGPTNDGNTARQGGGGGGAFAWWMLLALAGIAAERRRAASYRH
jgi:photosystem II stability/assembly factor-like uncharacterized protein